MTGPLLLFSGHPNHGQFTRVAFQVTRETLTQRGRVARIGLHPAALFVQFARSNDVAMRSGSDQLPLESKPQAAHFINHMHAVSLTKQRFHPRHKLIGTEPPRRLGQELIILRYRHVNTRLHVQTDLDLRPLGFTLFATASSEAAPS
jgi:hypothetical protein